MACLSRALGGMHQNCQKLLKTAFSKVQDQLPHVHHERKFASKMPFYDTLLLCRYTSLAMMKIRCTNKNWVRSFVPQCLLPLSYLLFIETRRRHSTGNSFLNLRVRLQKLPKIMIPKTFWLDRSFLRVSLLQQELHFNLRLLLFCRWSSDLCKKMWKDVWIVRKYFIIVFLDI